MDHTPFSSRLGLEESSGEDGVSFGQAYDVPGVGLAGDGDTVVEVNDALRAAGGVGTASGVMLGLAIAAGGVLAPAFGAIADHFSLHTALAVLIVLSPIALLITRQLPEPHRASTAAHRT